MATATTAPSTRIRRPLALAGGLLALAVVSVPLEQSSAAFTSQSVNPAAGVTAAPDWTPPTVSLTAPDAIRGTVSLTADASDGESGIARVTISWAPSETTNWTALCTRTVAPYTCSFNTLGLPEAEVDLRAVAIDGAGYSATAIVEGVLVDNVAPTASFGTVATTLSGVVTIPVNASDDGSGVATVTIQYAPAGTTAWNTICTDTTAPWSCRFDTTTVPDGTYDLRAIVTDVAGNSTTTATLRNRTIDNRQASVSMDPPPAFLRGLETLTASGFSTAGVTSIRIQWSRTGTTTWNDICTDTTSPYSCDWSTIGLADGDYSFRAILLDGSGKTTTSAVVGPSRLDNSPVRGLDVQAANGTKLGLLDAGDTVTVTYTRQMRLTSFLAGWDGTARAVTLRLRDGGVIGLGGSDDTLDVFTSTNLATPVHVGSVNLRNNHVKAGKTITIGATMTQQVVMVNGLPATAITFTVGTTAASKPKELVTATAAATMTWTPSASAVDLDGIATSAAPVNELGDLDRDL
jgi:chitinase